MLRGLILNTSGDIKILAEEKKEELTAVTDLRSKPFSGPIQIIDTRELDYIVISRESSSGEEIYSSITDFVTSMKETNNGTVALNLNGCTRYVEKEKILFIEVIGRDCFIYMDGGKYKLSRNALCHVMETIDDPYLVRCHKSYAINVRHIDGLRKVGRGLWKPLVNGCDSSEECLIGRSYYKSVISKHDEWLKHLNKLK